MTTRAIRPQLLRMAKACLDPNLSKQAKAYAEGSLLSKAKVGSFIFNGVSKFKYVMPDSEQTWSTNFCLHAWLEAAKEDKQLDFLEGLI